MTDRTQERVCRNCGGLDVTLDAVAALMFQCGCPESPCYQQNAHPFGTCAHYTERRIRPRNADDPQETSNAMGADG